MTHYVVDTSVTAKLFLEEDERDIALKVYHQADIGSIRLLAPSLTWYELNSVFSKQQLPAHEIKSHFSMFQKLINQRLITIIPQSQRLLNKSIELVDQINKLSVRLSTYDTVFHALAILRNATFLTADEKYYKKVCQNIGSISLLTDFQ